MNVILYDQIFYFIMFVTSKAHDSVSYPPGPHPKTNTSKSSLYRILCCSFMTILAYYFDEAQLGAFISFTNATIPSLLGSHILFNLRAKAGKATDINHGTDGAPRLASQLATISDICFSWSMYNRLVLHSVCWRFCRSVYYMSVLSPNHALVLGIADWVSIMMYVHVTLVCRQWIS